MIRDKLKSSSGETLSETMVAALIAGLGLLLLAGMIMSATHIVQRGDTAVNEYYTGVSNLDAEEESRKENEGTPTESTTQVLDTEAVKATISYQLEDQISPQSSGEIAVTKYKEKQTNLISFEHK